jgi:hypothetical protein
MTRQEERRKFLQSSIAAGAVLGLAGVPRFGNSGPAFASSGGEADNPRVAPGRVRWHASFNAACDAARSSHKPVFLFHMMGRLDQRFC